MANEMNKALLKLTRMAGYDFTVCAFNAWGHGKLICAAVYPKLLRELNALATISATEVLQLAFLGLVTTPFGSSAAAIREAIRTCPVRAAAVSRVAQLVSSGLICFGWEFSTGHVLAMSAFDLVERTYYDGSLQFMRESSPLRDAQQIFHGDLSLLFRTRAAFVETHVAECRIRSSEYAQQIDAHREAEGVRRTKKGSPPDNFPSVSCQAALHSCDVVFAFDAETGQVDPDVRPQFISVAKPTNTEFTRNMNRALALSGVKAATCVEVRKKTSAKSKDLPAVLDDLSSDDNSSIEAPPARAVPTKRKVVPNRKRSSPDRFASVVGTDSTDDNSSESSTEALWIKPAVKRTKTPKTKRAAPALIVLDDDDVIEVITQGHAIRAPEPAIASPVLPDEEFGGDAPPPEEEPMANVEAPVAPAAADAEAPPPFSLFGVSWTGLAPPPPIQPLDASWDELFLNACNASVAAETAAAESDDEVVVAPIKEVVVAPAAADSEESIESDDTQCSNSNNHAHANENADKAMKKYLETAFHSPTEPEPLSDDAFDSMLKGINALQRNKNAFSVDNDGGMLEWTADDARFHTLADYVPY